MRDRPYIICFVAVVLLLYSLFDLSAVMLRKSKAEERLSSLLEERETLQKENEFLTGRLRETLRDSDIEDMARQRLGLVMQDERVYYFID